MRACLFVLAVLAACGGGGESTPDAMPRETVTESLPLAVNEIREAILVGGNGDMARLVMMAPSPSLDWNIHAHPNGSTVVVDEAFQVMDVDYVFKPKDQADWYLLVRNKGVIDMTVTLEIELYGNMTWSGWQ